MAVNRSTEPGLLTVSRTPLRISLVGGGTDLRAFYWKEPGSVVSTTIDKYIDITVKRSSQKRAWIDEFTPPMVREAMKLTGVSDDVEVSSAGDLALVGTGLGSSSAYLVGLISALWAYRGVEKSPRAVADEACEIEIVRMRQTIGKQDQYIAAFGGLQHFRFYPNESVDVDPVICSKTAIQYLQDSLMLFHTGINRILPASEILAQQDAETEIHRKKLRLIVELAEEVSCILRSGESLDRIGELLHQSWEIKRGLAAPITNPMIDQMYAVARRAGALGGKITGAGGGGFLLLWVRPENQYRVQNALFQLRRLSFRLEPRGSRIICTRDQLGGQ